MSLSAYDLLAFDNDGKPSNGVMTCPGGQSLEIRKNWLYVHDKRMWYKGCGYMKYTISDIWQGQVKISGIRIFSKRGPQESIFVFAEHVQYPKNFKTGKEKFTHMAGIGAYGWDNPTARILKAAGKRIPKGAELMVGSESDGKGHDWVNVSLWFLNNKDRKKDKIVNDWIRLPERESLKSKFLGILPSTVEEFFKWLEQAVKENGSSEGEKWLSKINRKKALRFNQGDAYFAAHLKEQIPATRPGKPDKPTLSKIVKAWTKKKGK